MTLIWVEELDAEAGGGVTGEAGFDCLDDILLVFLVHEEAHLAVRAVECLDTAFLKVAAHCVADEVQVLLRWDDLAGGIMFGGSRFLGRVFFKPVMSGLTLPLVREGFSTNRPVQKTFLILPAWEDFAVFVATSFVEHQLPALAFRDTDLFLGE